MNLPSRCDKQASYKKLRPNIKHVPSLSRPILCFRKHCGCLVSATSVHLHFVHSQDAQNWTRLDPLCVRCMESLELNAVYVSEWQQLCDSRHHPPYLFSVDWFETLFTSLAARRRTASGYPASLGFSASVVLAEDLQFVAATLPPTIKSLLSNPPVMEKLKGNGRRCRRCQSLETDGYYDKLCQALDGSSATDLSRLQEVLWGVPPRLQISPTLVFQPRIIRPLLALLRPHTQNQERNSLAPEVKQFLSCSLVHR